MGTTKDKITNLVALILAISGAVTQILLPIRDGLENAANLDWMTIALVVGASLVAYFTGKGSDGKPKKVQ